MALCILEYDDKHTGLLCFEEPENGIHPFRIGAMAHLLKDLSIDFSDIQAPLRQVIVNTHSPVLLQQVYKWKLDKSISIWYASMRDRVTNIGSERVKMSVTSILPVDTQKEQLTLNFSEQDKKLTLLTVQKYLEVVPENMEL